MSTHLIPDRVAVLQNCSLHINRHWEEEQRIERIDGVEMCVRIYNSVHNSGHSKYPYNGQRAMLRGAVNGTNRHSNMNSAWGKAFRAYCMLAMSDLTIALECLTEAAARRTHTHTTDGKCIAFKIGFGKAHLIPDSDVIFSSSILDIHFSQNLISKVDQYCDEEYEIYMCIES